jgi:hypothetical protein
LKLSQGTVVKLLKKFGVVRDSFHIHSDFDGDAGLADMMDDFQEALFNEGLEDEPEETAKAFYDMLSSAQKPLHEKTMVSQLDAIGRLLGLKSQYSMSRDNFNGMLTVFGTLLPKGHILPKNLYESQKLLCALKMLYEQIHTCPNGCVLFRKDHKEATHCPKCKSSRYLEVDTSDGKKEQLHIPVKVLRYLPFIPRIQRLYMIEKSAKQMTWHKNGKRYNPNKMVHPSDGDAWTHLDGIHHGKAEEAQKCTCSAGNRWVQPIWIVGGPVHLLARVRDPPQSPPASSFNPRTYSCR